jgi:DNA-binding CsgD family transcriptional regulator/PAS domain-containing protein
MATSDSLLTAIEAIYAAGLDEALWPSALAQVMLAVGGIAATLERFERSTASLIEFHSYGLPPANEVAYLDHYSAINPRIPALINGRPGDIVTDYALLDERSMNRHPFYADLLAPAGYRYCVGGTLAVTACEASLFSVQRTTKQGHVGKNETKKMRLLLPHMRQAFDMTRRLRRAKTVDRSFRAALDWLSDGVALLGADGRVLYVNETLQAIARRGEGIRIRRGTVEIADPAARDRFANMIGTTAKARDGVAAGDYDIAVPRQDGAPPYIVSMRPLARAARGSSWSNADIIMLVHDPLQYNSVTVGALSDLFGLTKAEANLAHALQAGEALADYALAHTLSLNTVYTHLRRLKEKTGCRRLAELIRKLDDLQIPLRVD